MRPNYAQDAPPTSIEVGGRAYPVNVDYRVWLDVVQRMGKLRIDPETKAQQEETAQQILEIEELVFGGWLRDESPQDVLHGIAEFAKGYPSAPCRSRSNKRTYDFEYDLNEIIIAIRNQSGIDLSYRRTEPFHWWEFLLEFRTLCGEHFILHLMEIRGYDGKDEAMKRRARDFALPERYTQEEIDEWNAFNAMFDAEEE